MAVVGTVAVRGKASGRGSSSSAPYSGGCPIVSGGVVTLDAGNCARQTPAPLCGQPGPSRRLTDFWLCRTFGSVALSVVTGSVQVR